MSARPRRRAARRLPATLLPLLALVVSAAPAQAAGWVHLDVPGAKAITVAPLPQGPTAAVWLDAADNQGIYGAIVDGGSIGTPVLLSDTPLPYSTLRVVANASGDALAVWADGHVMSALKPHGASWQAAQSGPATGPSTRFQAALADDGTAYAAWHDGAGVYLATRPAGGSWSSATPVNGAAYGVEDLALSVGSGASPAVTLAWTQHGPDWNSPTVVQQRTRTGGGAWGTVQQLSAPLDSNGFGAAEHVQLGRAADGTVRAAWVRSSSFGPPQDPASGMPSPWSDDLGTVDLAALAPGATQFSSRTSLFADTVARHSSLSLVVHRAGTAEVFYTDAYGPAVGGKEGGGLSVLPHMSAYDPWGALAPDDTTTVVLNDQSHGSVWWTGSDFVHPITPASPDLARPDGIHFDRDGDVVVAANDVESGSVDRIWAYDSAAPSITVHAPSSADAGAPVTLSADVGDLWSATTDVSWSFGDGAGATGTSVQHAFSGDGDHAVTVTATDAAGNVATETVHVTAGAAPSAAGTPTVSGAAVIGGTLTGAGVAFTGAPAPAVHSSWLRCDGAGADCVAIAGTDDAATYSPGQADAGHRLRFAQTATNAIGTAIARSEPTELVAGPSPSDVHGPEIVIAAPAAGQHFTLGQHDDASRARWSCTDAQAGDSGVASATGTVADGASLDTGSLGAHALTVVCQDHAGHSATRTQGYVVDPAPAPVKVPAAQAKVAAGASKALPTTTSSGTLVRSGLTERVSAPAGTLLGNVLTATAPVITLGGGNVITLGGGNVITAGGGNVITAGGGNVITAGGGNVITAGGGNVITAGGGNVITAGGGNVITAGGGNAMRPAASARLPMAWSAAAKQTVLARGGYAFKKAGAAKVHIRLTAAGRAYLKATARRHRHGKVRLYALTVTGSTKGSTPAVVAVRRITVRL